jgi:hypothetical protein
MVNCAASFVVGLFAGICAVFVPRLGGLLVADDLNKVSVFPTPFILLGLIYAAIVGAVVAILYFGKTGTPGERFMTALGIPALLAGAISTSAQTGKVQQLQVTSAHLADAAAKAANIRKNETPIELQPLSPPVEKGASAGPGLERLLGIGSAFANDVALKSAPKVPEKWSNWTPIQVEESSYAVILDKSPTAESARKRASELKMKIPNAKAVKIEGGYGVIAGIQSESSAVLEAIRIQRDLGIRTELNRVK